jgi:carbamoyltransferase
MEESMIIAGVKLTQSGGIALLRDGRLEFNIEIQKLDNNARYSDVEDLKLLPQLLADQNYDVADVDEWVIDGWDGAKNGHVELRDHGAPLEVLVAPYRETERVPNPGRPGHQGIIEVSGEDKAYASYVHVASHLGAAYCTSPFARRGEPSMVLVWDGGCFPRLYYVDADGRIEPGGELFPLIGHAYSMASQHFGPYRRDYKSDHVDDLSVAGKLMAYIALGSSRDEIKAVMRELFHEHFEADTAAVEEYRNTIIGCGSTGEPSHRYVHAYLTELRERMVQLGADDDDVLATVHEFTEELLMERIAAKMRAWKGDGPFNLCFAGGCALNIKWNTALRGHPMVKAMWVPPFPDDSGSAVGAAAIHRGRDDGLRAIDWQVRLGPDMVRHPHTPEGWSVSPCRPEELARILHRTGRPVIVLRGRAELGPRALGARSIIAPAVDPGMKDHLNQIKHRENYRPVAPICLEEYASDVFDPGTPDPYMLFEHRVRPEWVDRVPAILHLDGTARLQTVSSDDDPLLASVLREYHKWSGVPVLCNTSANLSGSGFFPDAVSAMNWGGVDLVWSEGVLHRRVRGNED